MKTKLLIVLCLALGFCACESRTGWTRDESALIFESDSVMRVLTVEDPADLLVLRTPTDSLTPEMLRSPEYADLEAKLVRTVTDPSQDGVGIAGPQVGISRRVIAVMRFDKWGDPFEVFPNVRITGHRGEREAGPEGCLSIPGRRGDVLRYQDIDIAYTSPKTLRDTAERILGFTAVIFQHECDHLDGVLFTDYLDSEPNQ